MQFSKAQKVLHDTNFNPPPGYYSYESANNTKPSTILNTNFAKQQRFANNQVSSNPGPGYYYNDKAERVRKRIIQQAKRKQAQFKTSNATQSEIKISSIPSIPKKSTTRVYEELAPGILILHQQQNQGTNIGPGSYQVNTQIAHKRTIAHKINPQHKKKHQIYKEPQIQKIPTIAQQIRNEKRQLYKRNLIKSTGVNKNMISPADLCLQVIILREKLLRSEQNPPPGYYYNEKYQSSFKQLDNDLLPQYQLMMGKQQRFRQPQQQQIGPGAYETNQQNKMLGGYIARGQKQLNNNKNPGPGAYKVESAKLMEPTNPKGNYPPIFGSGNSRNCSFGTQISQTPGPGSYTIQKSKNKKQKYIKIKRNVYQSHLKPYNREDNKRQLVSFSGDKSRSQDTSYTDQRKKQKNNHFFNSKVDRFPSKNNDIPVGPGQYNTNKDVLKLSFNKHLEYTGSKQPRFDDTMVRPHLGPGAYFKYQGQST